MKWLRKRQRWMVAIVTLMLIGLAWIWIVRSNLAVYVTWAAVKSGYQVSIRSVRFQRDYSIEVKRLKLGNVVQVERILIHWNWKGLFNKEIESIHMDGMAVLLSQLSTLNEKKEQQVRASKPWTLRKLTLSRIHLTIDNLGEGLPPLTLQMARSAPFISLENVKLGGSGEEPGDEKLQMVRVSDFAIYSPYDPAARVISFEAIDAQFSWSGLLHKKLEFLHFHQPCIYMGSDLFWFSDEISRAKKSAPAAPTEPWRISKIQVSHGKLIVAIYGQEAFTIPGEIEGELSDVVVGDFTQLHLKARFRTFIPELNYPEYSLRMKNVVGFLDFNLPPTQTNVNNLVRTFEIEQIEWKGVKFGLPKNPAWVSITMDRDGLYSTFGAPGLEGYLNGGVAVYLANQTPWLAWGSVNNVEVFPLTDLLSSEYVTLQGKFKGVVEVRGRGRSVEGMSANVKNVGNGVLNIPATQQLLDRLPEKWALWKKELTKVSLEEFKSFDYKIGACEFSYHPPESYVKLTLEGDQGKRNFNIEWKDLRPDSTSFILPLE